MGNIFYSASEILFKDANVLIQFRDWFFSQSGQYIISSYYILGRSLCY